MVVHPRESTHRTLEIEECESRIVLAAPSSDPAQIVDGVAFAHQLGLTGAGQTVAIIDTGVAYDHPALGGGFGTEYRVVGGFDFTEEQDGDPYDDGPAGYHGTHVAGIIAGNHDGFHGIAPDIDLVGLRVFNDQGVSDFDWVEASLQWVIDHRTDFEHPITTVNLSLGSGWQGENVPEWAILEDELRQLDRIGVFVTVAAGNNFQANPVAGLNYPATSPHVVAVGSHDNDDRMSSFSRRSAQILAAPGRNVYSTIPDYLYDFNGVTDDYASLSGSSMAAPLVAGASVLVREALQRYSNQRVTADLVERTLRLTASKIHDDITGQAYDQLDLRAALDSIVPASALGNSVKQSIVNLGALTDTQVRETLVPSQTYELVAARAGWLTLEISDDQRRDLDVNSLAWTIEDADGNPLQRVSNSTEAGRADAWVAAGQVVRFHLFGIEQPTEVRMTNALTVRRGAAYLFGTEGHDSIELSLQSNLLGFNGLFYPLDWMERSALRIDGRGGHDTVTAQLTSSPEEITFEPLVAKIDARDYDIQVSGVENNKVYAGGASDLVRFVDSEGQDHLVISPDYSVMEGRGFSNYIASAERVRAYSKHGGSDTVRLVDTPGDDQFVSLPQYSALTGLGFSGYVTGFATLRVVASRGGNDRAVLYDSEGDDEFYGVPEYASLRTHSRDVVASYFEDMRSISKFGGLDTARLFDSPGDDRFFGLPDYSELKGGGFRHHVTGYHLVRAYANAGGDDRADFYDSERVDQFFGLPQYASMVGPEFDNYAAGFESVRAYSRSGDDVAKLFGSTGDDLYVGLPEYGVLEGDDYRHFASGFSQVIVDATQGGNDETRLIDSVYDDLFTADARGRASLVGPGFRHELVGFSSVLAKAVRGGSDRGVLAAGAADQVFRAGSVFVGLQFALSSAESTMDDPGERELDSFWELTNEGSQWRDFYRDHEFVIEQLLQSSFVGDHLVAAAAFENLNLFS